MRAASLLTLTLIMALAIAAVLMVALIMRSLEPVGGAL